MTPKRHRLGRRGAIAVPVLLIVTLLAAACGRRQFRQFVRRDHLAHGRAGDDHPGRKQAGVLGDLGGLPGRREP